MLHQHRAQFPALKNKTYFNYGGTGPMPQSAIDVIIQTQAHIQDIGPFSMEVYQWIAPEIAKVRTIIAQELNIPTSTITLTDNISVGCNIAIWGIDWQPGDRLLLSDCEYPGVVAMAQEVSRRFGVEITTCPLFATLNGGDPAEIIAQNLQSNTRLVILSHITWNTGQFLPIDKIGEICRNNGSLLLIDAAQSGGVLPLNLTELAVDFYAFTGHKWFCGPAGVGGLYVSPTAREKLQPTFIGLSSVMLDDRSRPINWQPDGRRYEISTMAIPLLIGLGEAIAYHHQWGTAEERYTQICHNSAYLWQKLAELPDIKCLKDSPPESGLVSFQLTNNQTALELVKFLESQRILTRRVATHDCIRVSTHYLTLESEIDQLIAEIKVFCSL
jgi:L-cysteine/cystine lyase